jgi:hypothetical protein
MIERNHLEKVLNYYENHVLKYFFKKDLKIMKVKFKIKFFKREF